MPDYPQKLAEMLEVFETLTDRTERATLLLDLADSFQEVPADVATPPFPAANRVEYCESEAYVWAREQPDHTLKFHFAVGNPQGMSARALAALLDKTLSGAPVDKVANVSSDIVFAIFGRDISMGKGQGLTGIVARVKQLAEQHLARQTSRS